MHKELVLVTKIKEINVDIDVSPPKVTVVFDINGKEYTKEYLDPRHVKPLVREVAEHIRTLVRDKDFNLTISDE